MTGMQRAVQGRVVSRALHKHEKSNFDLFVERDDDHFEEEEGLVDVGGFSQGLARRARFVGALAACQVHHVQLRAPHLRTQGTPNHKAHRITRLTEARAHHQEQ